MNTVTALLVAIAYGLALGAPAGALAGCLVGFSLFAVHVVTYPVYPETLGMRLERERLAKLVAGLVLVTAFGGLALARVLI